MLWNDMQQNFEPVDKLATEQSSLHKGIQGVSFLWYICVHKHMCIVMISDTIYILCYSLESRSKPHSDYYSISTYSYWMSF